MGEKYFIGIDSGSQSTKVSIITEKGKILHSFSQPLKPMISRQQGWVEHPGDDLWDSLQSALRNLTSSFKGNIGNIIGVGLCSIRCCRVFLKSDGTLAAPVMSWMDIRAYETFQNDPGIAYTGSTSGYLTFRLTGELKDTISNSFQYQFPVDMTTWKWLEDPEKFSRFGIPREKLLEMHLPGEILGRITEEASRRTGLPAGLPVVSTANDKSVEALGSGLIEPDIGLLSLGTYTTAMVFGGEYREATDNTFTNLSCVPHQYLYECAGIRGGMWHISWILNLLGEEFREKAASVGCGIEELLEREAIPVPPGSDGLLITPDWLAPADELHKKGVMIGFDQRHTRGHIYRAMMEALAMSMKNNFDAMNHELGIRPQKFIVCGGGSNSDLFMQIAADVFGVTAVRNQVNGAAGLGASICAAVGTGYYRSFDDAVKHMVHADREFSCNESSRRVYKQINHGIYRNLSSLLSNALEKIHSTINETD